jgi:hypothetical protein
VAEDRLQLIVELRGELRDPPDELADRDEQPGLTIAVDSVATAMIPRKTSPQVLTC